MKLALFIWVCTIATSIVLTVIVCKIIEKSKVKRWGATGSLFKYE
jgi:hypothetical protein